jgi:type 1 glutamine amidotransferase
MRGAPDRPWWRLIGGRGHFRATVIAIALALIGAGFTGADSQSAVAGSAEGEFQVLVFSHTTGYRHASIPAGIEAIRALGADHGVDVAATEAPSPLTRGNLRGFEAVIFLNTTGDVLPERQQQRALRRYVHSGGGYVGIHSAADTEHDWPYYGRLVGAYFKSHPIQQLADFENEGPRQPATEHLDTRFTVFDEFYSFKSNPRPDVRVLLTIDEDSYSPDPNTTHLPGGTPSSGYMGDHPMSWCHDNLGGRAFYTALGHEIHLYELDWYRRHVLGGILTATKQVKARCSPPAG